MARQERTSYDVNPQARQPFNLDALVQGGPDIEVVEADADFRKIAEDADFMNETVYVRFISSGNPNTPKVVELGANIAGHTGKWQEPTEDFPNGRPGVAQGGGKSVRRGFMTNHVYPMPRFLLEVVAHAKTTTLEQVADPRNPMEIMHVERHSFTYPFELVRDDNPKGRQWLEHVMRDPA